MYRNRARVEHSLDVEKCDEDFKMADVTIPLLQQKPHAISVDFRDQVRFPLPHPFLSYMWRSLVMIAGSSKGPRPRNLLLYLPLLLLYSCFCRPPHLHSLPICLRFPQRQLSAIVCVLQVLVLPTGPLILLSLVMMQWMLQTRALTALDLNVSFSLSSLEFGFHF